jgi:ABC-2 type transport system permease protein
MTAYFMFELRRLIREPRLLIFTVLMPVASYVVFTGVTPETGTAEGLQIPATMMIGLAGYGAIIGVLSMGVGVSTERTQGWLRQLRITPLRSWQVVVVKTVISTLVAIPSVLTVGLAGHLQHHIDLPAGRWALIVLALWLGTIPFAMLGLAIGYALPPNLAQPTSFLTFFTLSVLGGLLVPVEAFPHDLQRFAHVLPSNRYAELGWRAATGHMPTGMGAGVLGGWTLLFCVLAVVAYRRSAATR